MKRLLFMVIVTIVVLASFARPERDDNPSINPVNAEKIKNTVNQNHNKTANSNVHYKKR